MPRFRLPNRKVSQYIEASVRFLTTEEGGRKTPASGAPGVYRTIAKVEGEEISREIFVTGGPEILELGVPLTVEILLAFYPEDPYAGFQPGNDFTICEGAHRVADGKVVRRWEVTE